MPTKNPVIRRAILQRYSETHREEILERGRNYREANREQLREKSRAYAVAHKEERAVYQREYAQRPEVIARKQSQSEAKREYMRKWQIANKEHRAEKWQEWYAKNRDYAIARGKTAWQIRRARKMAAGRVETIRREVVFERDGGRCHICRRKVSAKSFHIDHLIPLSKGGDHTYDNVATAHPKCNLRRNDGKLPAQLRLVA